MKLFHAPKLTDKQVKHLFERIHIDSTTGCWNWTGAAGRYGSVGINYKTYITHRLMYALTYGPIPTGRGHNAITVDHLCHNTLCCNPNHLELKTLSENILAGNGLSARRARQTHCKNGHPLPPPIKGHRTCQICLTTWRKNYQVSHREEHAAYERARKARIRAESGYVPPAPPTHCLNGHPLPPKVKGQKRRCYICMRDRSHQHYMANRKEILSRQKSQRSKTKR